MIRSCVWVWKVFIPITIVWLIIAAVMVVTTHFTAMVFSGVDDD